jgi:transcriptional regulator with PAS, ATPase and Fis domain
MSTVRPTLDQFKQAFSTFGVVQSRALENAIAELLPAVLHDIPILLVGPSGTGKTALAATVHRLSRPQKHFIECNCAALPAGLVESELFGHVKGAFTGAVNDKVGVFGQASGGTILLDEIGELELSLQAKLLQVLNNGKYRRVGESEMRLFNGRLITATNRDLHVTVRLNSFREDLFYRVARRVVRLPSLSEQPEAVWPAFLFSVDKYLRKYGSESAKAVFKNPDSVQSVLLQHAWPGNFRELDNCAENVVVQILYGDLPISPEIVGRFMHVGEEQSSGLATIEKVEELQIERALALCNGVFSRAAAVLHISPQTLARKVTQYEIEVNRFQKLQYSNLETPAVE